MILTFQRLRSACQRIDWPPLWGHNRRAFLECTQHTRHHTAIRFASKPTSNVLGIGSRLAHDDLCLNLVPDVSPP